MLTDKQVQEAIDRPLFRLIGEAADELGVDAYVVGGYVRDLYLGRPSKDVDVVAVGKGIDLARAVARRLGKGTSLSIYARFGTAQVKSKEYELEFVGARRESYSPESRNPVVEDGSLEDDLRRRDFTINALAAKLNPAGFGVITDLFDGLCDLEDYTIRTPLDPVITFDDDPLRMLRAIRFASQLGFFIEEKTFESITNRSARIEIISQERIAIELNKILLSPRPSVGLGLLRDTGLLQYILPEVYALKGAETREGVGHKENLTHTFAVVDNLAKKSEDLWLRWAALLHDIGKARTKRFDKKAGWTFHNHNIAGAKMVPVIFRRLCLPLDGKMRFVRKMVDLHMRPQNLVDEGVSDSAVRRLLFDAGDDIDSLMTLCEADITSKNPDKVRRYTDNYGLMRKRLTDLEERDRIRNFQPPIDGTEIMRTFALGPSPAIGLIKEHIKNAILDGHIPNEYNAAYRLMIEKASELGLPDPGENPSSAPYHA